MPDTPAPNCKLYVVFSSTPGKMGRMIRVVTREPFNHVSLALSGDLTRMYSFARRYDRTPFLGGFVEETPARFHRSGRTAQILVCALPLTASQYTTLLRLLHEMKHRREQYLYNHLSALAAPCRRRISVPDAFTCVEFAVYVLSSLGISLRQDTFYSVGELAELLAPHTTYAGCFPVEAVSSDPYLRRTPLRHPVLRTAADFARLCRRKWRIRRILRFPHLGA